MSGVAGSGGGGRTSLADSLRTWILIFVIEAVSNNQLYLNEKSWPKLEWFEMQGSKLLQLFEDILDLVSLD